MTGDDMFRRLEAAERVCALLGISVSRSDTDRDKAVTQAWMDWHRDYGHLTQDPTDAEVVALASRRDITRNMTLLRLDQDGGAGFHPKSGDVDD
ncbi:hypothetical protein AB0B94_31270 [Micromonospora sp. NPDC048986]|uniref:hypothetical protein n=1 Tax=Micromonospora sp. NPDC048986 TaxID=3155644 RepID=UPI0033ECD64B